MEKKVDMNELLITDPEWMRLLNHICAFCGESAYAHLKIYSLWGCKNCKITAPYNSGCFYLWYDK